MYTVKNYWNIKIRLFLYFVFKELLTLPDTPVEPVLVLLELPELLLFELLSPPNNCLKRFPINPIIKYLLTKLSDFSAPVVYVCLPELKRDMAE